VQIIGARHIKIFEALDMEKPLLLDERTILVTFTVKSVFGEIPP